MEKGISLAECKKILNSEGENYSDEEVNKIRGLLWEWAQLHAEQLLKNQANAEIVEHEKDFS